MYDTIGYKLKQINLHIDLSLKANKKTVKPKMFWKACKLEPFGIIYICNCSLKLY